MNIIYIKDKMKKIIILLCGIILISCNNSTHKRTIKLQEEVENLPHVQEEDIINNMELVQLDSESKHLGRISKIVQLDNFLYLLDQQAMCLHIFTTKGEYVNSIEKQGHGSGEYIYLSDIFIDKKKKTINLLCSNEKKVMVYDLCGKRMIEEKRIPKSFTYMAKTLNGYVGYMGNYTEDIDEPYNYFILDEQMNVVDKCCEINKDIESTVNADIYPISTYKDKCNLITEMSYDVFTVSKNQSSHYFQFDFGKYNLPKQVIKDITGPFKQDKEFDPKYVYYIYRFQETEKYILAYLYFNTQNILYAYDKKSKNSKFLELSFNKEPYFLEFGRIVGFDECRIHTLISACDVREIYIGHNRYNDFLSMYPNQIKNLRERISEPKDSDNPFIMIYNLK